MMSLALKAARSLSPHSQIYYKAWTGEKQEVPFIFKTTLTNTFFWYKIYVIAMCGNEIFVHSNYTSLRI